MHVLVDMSNASNVTCLTTRLSHTLSLSAGVRTVASVSPRPARYSHTDTYTPGGRVISVISVASLSDRSLSYDCMSSDIPITAATSAKFAHEVSSVKVHLTVV